MPEIKKTLVVGINLHGEIPLDINGCPITKTILPNNYIIKLNIVAPGIPNISTISNYNHLCEVARDFVQENKWLNSVGIQPNDKNKIQQFVSELKNKFVNENKDNVDGVKNEYFTHLRISNAHCNRHFAHINSTQAGDLYVQRCKKESSQSFVHNINSMYGITEFNSGDLIIDKLFYKFTPDELGCFGITDEDIQDQGFNKIVLYNFSDDGIIYDVFEILTEVFGTELTEITLFQLIDFLTGMGTENIILIDLSCSVFRPCNNRKMTAREIRYARRSITKK